MPEILEHRRRRATDFGMVVDQQDPRVADGVAAARRSGRPFLDDRRVVGGPREP